jgi:hypothetical protein
MSKQEPSLTESEAAMSEHRKLPLEVIQRAVRGAVCTICYQRPRCSELLPNSVARSCEDGCPIFFHLPALYRIAVEDDTSAPGALETAVKRRICAGCHLAPTAGDDCVEFAERTCPLSRFAREVVTLIETLRLWQHHGAKH